MQMNCHKLIEVIEKYSFNKQNIQQLISSEYLSKEEINQASEAYPLYGPKVFNPQQQIPLGWSNIQKLQINLSE